MSDFHWLIVSHLLLQLVLSVSSYFSDVCGVPTVLYVFVTKSTQITMDLKKPVTVEFDKNLLFQTKQS